MTTQTLSLSHARFGLAPILGAAFLGLALIFAAGFSSASVLHDAAHDTRHALAFPCH